MCRSCGKRREEIAASKQQEVAPFRAGDSERGKEGGMVWAQNTKQDGWKLL